ncbi:MAG TPA: glycosyltransferase, partial [Terricaulis sp.]|nr:glycosyltransferase [Terricaulis sp.]
TGADAVYVDMLRLAPLARDLPRKVALIVDYDDLLSARYRLADRRGYDVLGFLSKRFGPLAGLARAFAAPLLASEAQRCAKYEAEMMQSADVALFTSPREAQAMVGKGPALVLAAPPTLAPHAPLHASPGERLIFLGNMHYGENIAMLRSLANAADALTADGAWPAGVLIEAVGDHAPDLPGRFPAAPIRFLGRVDDLATLAGAGVFLAPVTSGSGVKLKVLDGMALSCPVAATPKALEGLGARANRDVLVAPDPKRMLGAALKLRTRARLKALLAKRARAYLERAHDPGLGMDVCEAIEAAIMRAKARA